MASSFWLEYTKDGERREFSFDTGTVSIGRDKAADFVLDHPTVSREHALIRAESQGHQLVVLSRGGLTALDGGQVQGEVPLYDGSEIHFGQLSFTFRSTSAPPKPAGQSYGRTPGFNASLGPSGTDGGLTSPFAADKSSNNGNIAGAGWDAGWDQPAEPEPEPETANGLVTWDQIANSAEAKLDYQDDDRLTNFQRIQAAQAKADKQTKGSNPWIIYGGVIGIVALIVVAMWPPTAGPTVPEVPIDNPAQAFIAWEKSDIDCIGKANCMEAAISAYKLGKNLAEQAGADITNPYEAYKQFDRAHKLLEAGQITTVPPEMANVTDLQAQVKDGLDQKFTQARIRYRNFKKRKMYKDMVGELNKVLAYFPDKRCLYNQWAVAEERQMKDDRVYPVSRARY